MRLLAALLATALPAAAQSVLVEYECERGAVIHAAYVNEAEPGIVILMVEGRMVELRQEPSGSGIRYGAAETDEGYVWLSRGNEAMLLYRYEGVEEEPILIGGCVERPR